jgi:hypothetical protein
MQALLVNPALAQVLPFRNTSLAMLRKLVLLSHVRHAIEIWGRWGNVSKI